MSIMLVNIYSENPCIYLHIYMIPSSVCVKIPNIYLHIYAHTHTHTICMLQQVTLDSRKCAPLDRHAYVTPPNVVADNR